MFRLGIEVFVLTSLHLSLAMSLLAVIDLNSLIPARCLYSTSKYGLEWTLIEINSFRGSNPSHCIALGRGRDTDRCRKKLGWRYEEIHKARDLDRFIDDLEKSLLHNG